MLIIEMDHFSRGAARQLINRQMQVDAHISAALTTATQI